MHISILDKTDTHPHTQTDSHIHTRTGILDLTPGSYEPLSDNETKAWIFIIFGESHEIQTTCKFSLVNCCVLRWPFFFVSPMGSFQRGMQILKNWYGGQLDASIDIVHIDSDPEGFAYSCETVYADFVRVYGTAHLKCMLKQLVNSLDNC